MDTHIHASQVPNIGLGLDMPLMEWLNAYTFPMETEYKNKDFGRHVYHKVVVSNLNEIIQLIFMLYNSNEH